MERIDTTRTEGDPLEDVLEKGKETPGQEEAAPVEQIPPVRYYKLFSTADGLDTFLMVIGAIGAMGNGALLPLFAIVFGEFTDAFGDPTNVDFMKVVSDIALKFLYLAIAAAVASYLEAGVWMFTGNRQTNRLRLKFLRAVLHQDVAFFDVQSTTGGLVQGLNEDSIDVQNAISEKLGAFLHHVCTFLVGFIIGFTKGWEMTLVMFGCMPFLALMGGWMAKSVEMANNATSKAYAEASAIAQQSISQIRTVAAYNREEESMKLYAKALDAPSRMIVTQSWVKGFGLGAIQFTMYGTYAAGLFFGAYRVAAGAYTGGQVLQVLMATLMGGFSLGQAAPNLQYFAKGCAAGGRMFRVIDRKPDISDVADLDAPEQQHTATHAKAANGNAAAAAAAASGKEVQLHTVEHKAALGDGGKIPAGRKHKQPDPLQPQVPSGPVLGEIQLQHVDFAYPSRPEILIFRDFSLHVPAGNTVALVGSSGSGKSTVVQLIERFYDPQAGAVLLDGRDLRTLPLRWLRSQVGLVSQEPTLFATTIYENIAIGLPGCSGEEVEAAARAANAHGFVSNLPLGYQTQVGERGVQLSGGQKQRIAIARAILTSPKVMLLDEATSALDTRSEALVQAALDRLVVGRTTVVVAHRLSTVQGADAIAVVQSGAVAQLGTHKELLRDETGPYAVLVKLQMEAQAKQQQAEEPEAVLEEGVEEGVPEEHVYDKHVSGALVLPAPDSGLAPAQLGGDGATHGKATLVTSYDGKGSGVAHQTSGSLAITLPHSVPAVDGVSGANAPKSGSVHGAQPAPRSGEKGAPASAAGADGAEQGKGQGDKDGKEAKEEPYQVPFKRLLSYAEGEGLACVIGCFASACAGAQHPAFAFVISSMIAIFYTLTPSELKKEASFYSWMFFVIAMGALISLMAQSVAFGRVAQAVSGRIRVQLFGSILRQEVGWFDEAEHSSGKLTANLATDATYVRGAVGDVFGVAFQNLTTLVLGYFIALAFDWRMALLITGVFPFIMFSMLLYMRFAMGFSSTADKLYASANQQVTEAFSSIRVIHAYNLQGFVAGTYEKMLGQANRLLVRQSTTSGLSFSYSNFVMFAMYAVIVYFMGVEIDRGWADFGDSLKAFMAILLAAMGMAQASLAFPDLGNAKAAIQRVFPIIDRVPPIDSAGQGGAKPDPETVSGEIEFRGVRFVYPLRPSVVIFNNFNLTVHPGRVTALVGESGSGKSTVVQLIERFYDPQAGAVLLDGVDVRQYNLRHLRSLIGLVSQEPLLFNGTVADNIRIGKQDATQEELEAAAEAANARSFIEALPEKYNTKVGEGGIQLSGGQKQRVAIARAVVKDPKVMLLDEATSALDARSEAVVQKALDRIMLGRTSVVIAHRLSTIRNAHTIAVVYRGAILEQGTHEELMALPHGSYARLVAAQSRDQQQHGAKA